MADEMEAQAHVWNLLLSYFKSMCLKSAVELGIADVLKKHGKPMELSDLMSALSISPSRTDSFRHFMRTLTRMGLFAEKEKLNDDHQVKYLLTASSHLLVSGETMNVIPLVSLEVDPWMVGPSQVIGPWFKSPSKLATPFELFFGKGVWEMASERPELSKLINEGMASASRLVGDAVIMTCGHVFKGLKSLVDVGGGTGTMARAIARAFPEIKCTVFDLPRVVLFDTLKEEDSVIEYVGGDMFVNVPHADAVLLKWILHDWNDEECVKILRCCKEAIPIRDAGGKIIIIEMVVDATIDKHSAETQLYFDLLMMMHTTGKEREESEWQSIFLAAGFNKYKITPCGDLQSIIELYP